MPTDNTTNIVCLLLEIYIMDMGTTLFRFGTTAIFVLIDLCDYAHKFFKVVSPEMQPGTTPIFL